MPCRDLWRRMGLLCRFLFPGSDEVLTDTFRDHCFIISRARPCGGGRAWVSCQSGDELEAFERIRFGQMTVIGNSTGPDLDWSVERLPSRRGLFGVDGFAFHDWLCDTERSIRRHCCFPAVKNGFWVRGSIDQKNLV